MVNPDSMLEDDDIGWAYQGSSHYGSYARHNSQENLANKTHILDEEEEENNKKTNRKIFLIMPQIHQPTCC